MDKFIARENVRRFKRWLDGCTDDRRRKALKQLLAKEQKKLANLQCTDGGLPAIGFVRNLKQDPLKLFAEMKEFASFTEAEQRYIRRSLEVALVSADAADHWARGVGEAAAIGLQSKVYRAIAEIRSLVSKGAGSHLVPSFLPALVKMSAFDLQQGRLTSFAAYRFLYERVVGPGVGPWLLSSFGAAAVMPCIHPQLRAELLRSIAAPDIGNASSPREAAFFPQWVEKVPISLV